MIKQNFTLVEIMIVVAIIGLLATIAIPSFVSARNTSRKNGCINNLRVIDGAKQQWAIFSDAAEDAVPSWTDLVAPAGSLNGYIRRTPVCRSGGIYTLGEVREQPTCSIGGHVY